MYNTAKGVENLKLFHYIILCAKNAEEYVRCNIWNAQLIGEQCMQERFKATPSFQ